MKLKVPIPFIIDATPATPLTTPLQRLYYNLNLSLPNYSEIFFIFARVRSWLGLPLFWTNDFPIIAPFSENLEHMRESKRHLGLLVFDIFFSSLFFFGSCNTTSFFFFTKSDFFVALSQNIKKYKDSKT